MFLDFERQLGRRPLTVVSNALDAIDMKTILRAYIDYFISFQHCNFLKKLNKENKLKGIERKEMQGSKFSLKFS